jgi:ubiquinone/menaquinone biosynthesis C-methylase UbiE
MPKHSKTKDRVLTVSDGYKKWSYNYGLDSNAVIYVENRHTMERLDDLQNLSIILGRHLDFGCGTGRCLSLFLDKVDKIIAVDQSPEMLSKCKEAYPDHDIIEFQQGGLASLRRIPENSLQSTICCLVLDHLNSDDLYDFFAIVYSKLKVGGWLYITDVNPEFSRLKQPFAKFIDNAGFVCRIEVYPHSQCEVAKAMKSAGFKKYEFREELVIDDDVLKWRELEGLVGFPLIVEYYAEKH